MSLSFSEKILSLFFSIIVGIGLLVSVAPAIARAQEGQACSDTSPCPSGYECAGDNTCTYEGNPYKDMSHMEHTGAPCTPNSDGTTGTSCPTGYYCALVDGEGKCESSYYASYDQETAASLQNNAASQWNNYWLDQNKLSYDTEAFGSTSIGDSQFARRQYRLTINAITSEIVGPEPEVTLAFGLPEDSGAIGAFTKGVTFMASKPPVKTSAYLADLGRQMNLVTPAYAQGTGFQALEPVLELWKAFRNISYVGFVLIFVVIGFMIMFRAKIGQQAALTIQQALPQIVITLLLVTFSYAIAAFMIDLIFFLIYLAVGAFEAFGILNAPSSSNYVNVVENIFFEKNILTIALQDLLSWGTDQAAGSASYALGDMIQQAFPGIIGSGLAFISAPLGYLIIAVAILIAVFKLFFQLLMAYIGLVFSVIFAPMILLFNAIPGSDSFGKWIKGLLANALVFPVTAVMILIAGALTNSQKFGIADDIGYQFSGTTKVLGVPFISGGFDTNAIQALIGIGVLMMLPKVVELVQKSLGVEGGLAGMMGSIAEPLSGGAGRVFGTAGMLGGAGYRAATTGSEIGRAEAMYGPNVYERGLSNTLRHMLGMGMKVKPGFVNQRWNSGSGTTDTGNGTGTRTGTTS
ncbi:hypothetical protein GYA49_02405 [Candidatus Beckwithbacteria bacterium]|nr:hypothetical protein [Candidatus Beckwithbacteria bacterium]